MLVDCEDVAEDDVPRQQRYPALKRWCGIEIASSSVEVLRIATVVGQQRDPDALVMLRYVQRKQALGNDVQRDRGSLVGSLEVIGLSLTLGQSSRYISVPGWF